MQYIISRRKKILKVFGNTKKGHHPLKKKPNRVLQTAEIKNRKKREKMDKKMDKKEEREGGRR